MNRLCKAGVIAVLGAGFLTLGLAAKQKPEEQTRELGLGSKTVGGLVRDIACPVQNKASTARRFNLECAKQCAKRGSPLVILTDHGEMYFPISESMPDTDQRKKLLPFVGKYVKATGEVYERSGTHAIVIREIKEDTSIHLTTDASQAE